MKIIQLGKDQYSSISCRSHKAVRNDHLQELEKRVAAVTADPSIALTPAQARALLKK